MPFSPSDAVDAPAARPYGLLGLVVSTLAILLGAVLILALAGAALFALLAAGSGWQGAVHRIAVLFPSTAPGDAAADRINIVVGAAAYIGTACSVLLAARFRGGARWADLVGWHAWDMGRGLRLVAGLLAATLCYSLVASAFIEHVYPQAKDWVKPPKETPWIVGFLALATLFAPVTEELLFRGWIFTSLRGTVGVRVAILVSAALFALAHWESTHLYALAVFPVGLALGYVRQRAGSVAASITLHSLYNGVAAVLLFVGK